MELISKHGQYAIIYDSAEKSRYKNSNLIFYNAPEDDNAARREWHAHQAIAALATQRSEQWILIYRRPGPLPRLAEHIRQALLHWEEWDYWPITDYCYFLHPSYADHLALTDYSGTKLFSQLRKIDLPKPQPQNEHQYLIITLVIILILGLLAYFSRR